MGTDCNVRGYATDYVSFCSIVVTRLSSHFHTVFGRGSKPQKHFKTFSKLTILPKAKALKTRVIAVVPNF